MRFPSTLIIAVILTTVASTASAQTPPPAPPGAVAPPPAPAPVVPPTYLYAVPGPGAPTMLPYRDGDTVPDGYHATARFNRGLILGGSITFGATYIPAAVTGASSKLTELLIPFAGPFLGAFHVGGMGSVGVGESLGIGLLVLDGLAQTAGAAMLIVGLAQKKQVLVRDELSTTTVRVTPLTMGHGGMGIGIVGAM